MASNKIKALALTSTIAMAAVIGSTSLAEARYCRAHYGWHRHCGGTYWGSAYRPARYPYWGSAYHPIRYTRCYRPGYYGYAGWPSYYGWRGAPGYYGYGGGLLGAGLGAGIGSGLFGWW